MARRNTIAHGHDDISSLGDASQFEDLLRDLRRNTAEAPEDIRGLVSQIVQHPHIDRMRREMLGNTSGQGMSASASASASVSASRRLDLITPPTLSVREEVRRAFTPTGGYVNGPRQRRRQCPPAASTATAKNAVKKVRTVNKNVFLLNSGMTSVPSKREMLYYYKRVASCVEISNRFSAEEMQTKIESLFHGKLEHLPAPRFHYVKADRSRIFNPVVEEGCVWDGARVLALCGAGAIYVMANGPILDAFDASLYISAEVGGSSLSDDENLPEVLHPSTRNPSRTRAPSTVTVTSTEEPPRTRAPSTVTVTSTEEGIDDDDDVLHVVVTQEDEIIMQNERLPSPVLKRPRLEISDREDAAGLIRDHLSLTGSKDAPHIFVSRLRPFRSFARAFEAAEMEDVHLVQVKFFDSMNTVDDGGPRRDFMHRLLRDILRPSSGLFVETLKGVTLTHNAQKLENRAYYWAGRALAFLVFGGGPSVAILSQAMYDFATCGYANTEPSMDNIPQGHIRAFIDKIQNAASDAELSTIISAVDEITLEDGASILMAAGVSTVLKLDAIPNAVKRLKKFYALGMFRSELEDFLKGLESYGFLSLLRSFPIVFRPILVAGTQRPVTGTDLLVMFQPTFSPNGANSQDKEDSVMELWTAYTKMVDRGETAVTAPQILRFASGVEEVPIIGWGDGKEPSLIFVAEPEGPLPMSSTCGPTILLPLWDYRDKNHFKQQFDTSVTCSPSILRD